MKIGIVGGGQLGWMLGLAAKRLGIQCAFLDPNPECPAGNIGERITADYTDNAALDKLSQWADAVTCEFENVPAESLARLQEHVTVRPGPHSFEIAQDRLLEKRFAEEIGIPVPAFTQVEDESQLAQAVHDIGLPAVLKSRSGGYDGKNQVVLRHENDLDNAFNAIGRRPAILETLVPFEFEVSALVVRGDDGEVMSWPPIRNEHRDGILHLSTCPCPDLNEKTQKRIQAHAAWIAEKLEHVGTLAVEFFVIGDEVWFNELAPRVHNSGHLTIEHSATSQFENHIRAVAGLPLGPTNSVHENAIGLMMNIVGDWPDRNDLLKHTLLHVHDYGKTPRPGRKIGHVTGVFEEASHVDDFRSRLESLHVPE